MSVHQIAEMKAESQHENEQILDMIRELNKEVKLQTLVINGYIPQEYQEKLEEVVQWHEETGDWHMVGGGSMSCHMTCYMHVHVSPLHVHSLE